MNRRWSFCKVVQNLNGCMQRGFHQPSKCISVAHAPTSTWSRVFHLNKHYLLKWCVWLIANSHGHLQQSRNPQNCSLPYMHRVGLGPLWHQLGKIITSVRQSSPKVKDPRRMQNNWFFVHFALYWAKSVHWREGESKRSCLTQHHSERGKPCTPTCDSIVHSEPCWKWDLIYSTLYCGPALQSHWFHSKQWLLPNTPVSRLVILLEESLY